MLKKIKYQLLFLSVLINGDNYGLGIIDEVSRITNDKINVPEGSVYPTLKLMEQNGLVTSDWEGSLRIERGARRRYYTITDKGMDQIREVKSVFSQVWKFVA